MRILVEELDSSSQDKAARAKPGDDGGDGGGEGKAAQPPAATVTSVPEDADMGYSKVGSAVGVLMTSARVRIGCCCRLSPDRPGRPQGVPIGEDAALRVPQAADQQHHPHGGRVRGLHPGGPEAGHAEGGYY